MSAHAPNHVTWSVGGRKQLHIWNLRPQFAYHYNFYGDTMAINGLSFTVSNVKVVLGENLFRQKRTPKLRFGGKGVIG